MRYSSNVHDLVDGVMLSCADTQLLLILAVGGSFYSTAQCTISLYHYFVAFHTVLVGLATSLLAYIQVRSPFEVYFSSLARLTIFGIGIGFLARTGKMLQPEEEDVTAAQAYLPARDQLDSLIILPAICILEKQMNPFANLTDEQKEHLTHRGLRRDVRSQAQVLMAPFILVAMVTLFGVRFRKTLPRDSQSQGSLQVPVDMDAERNKMANLRFYISGVLKTGFWLGALVIIVLNWVTIGILRGWVDRSEWLNKEDGNPEKDVRGVGQLAPLVSLGFVGFAFLDGLWSFAREWWFFKQYVDDDDEDDEAAKTAPRTSFELQPSTTYASRP